MDPWRHTHIQAQRALSANGYNVVANVGLTKLCARDSLSSFLTELRSAPPDLLWITVGGTSLNPTRDRRVTVATALLATTMLDLGNNVVFEGNERNKGWQHDELSTIVHDSRLQHSSVFWCSLGIHDDETQQPINKTTRIVSTLHLAVFFSSCCGKPTHVQVRRFPERLVSQFYASVSQIISGIRAESSQTDSMVIYHAKSKKKAKPAVSFNADEEDAGPGEHAETRLLNRNITHVPLEEWFDDCGDCTSPLDLGPDDTQLFLDGESTDSDSADEEYNCLFNQSYFNHAMPGSDVDDIPGLPSWDVQFVYLMRLSGRDAVAELFGGLGKVVMLAVRRGMPGGKNYDIVVGLDLTNPRHRAQFKAYQRARRPLVLVVGPPCTSMGGWSRLNRIKNYAAWRESRDLGELLAEVTAEAINVQLDHGDHFLAENPLNSDLWTLPSWVKLASRPGVVTAKLHQCQVGLTDIHGQPVRKATLLMASDEALVRRLRRLCPGDHEHSILQGSDEGGRKTRQAQTWPMKMVGLIVDGIKDLWLRRRSKSQAYPVIPAMAVQDDYGGLHPTQCRGCKSHLRRDDALHDRRAGICRFPNAAPTIWSCPACERRMPSQHPSHSLQAGHSPTETPWICSSCQWFSRCAHAGNLASPSSSCS